MILARNLSAVKELFINSVYDISEFGTWTEIDVKGKLDIVIHAANKHFKFRGNRGDRSKKSLKPETFSK